MRSFQTLALGLAAVSAVAAAGASDVHELKKDTFEPFIKDHDLVLAEFFAPWCGHCKALAPEYEEAATQLKEKNIALAKVDCTEEADLCQSYGVEGYPTLKVFRGLDSIAPYSGQRKAPAIISYMTKQALPAVSDVTADSIGEFKGADKVVLVSFFDAKDTKSNETYTSIANGLRDTYLFGASSDADLAKAEGVKVPGVVLYKKFDEGKAVYDGKFDKADIEEFIKTASTPLIGEVGPETYSGYMAAGIPLGYIFAETAEEREQFAKEFKPIAEKHKGKINMAVIDAKQFGQHGQNLNLEVGKWPAFAIQDTSKNTKYPYDQSRKLTEKDIGSFVDDFIAGKIEPSVKSEPIPENQDGPVTIIVAHNFEEIVKDEKKDVLVEYYAPWCGHCKSLAPKYDELGTLFKKFSDSVTIAKVDATSNDLPEEVQGFPTIKLYPAGKKDEGINYSGGRTVEDLAAFIKDNGSHGIDVYEGKPPSDSAETDMPEQAAAATDKVKEAVKDAAEGAQKVVEAATGDDGDMDDHDEL